MSIERPITSMKKETLMQLISDIAAVEDFYKKPISQRISVMNSKKEYNTVEDDLPDKVKEEIKEAKAKQNPSTFFYRNSPDPVLRNADNTLTKEGEKMLISRMEAGGVDIGEDDDISLDPEKLSLTSHKLSLTSHLIDLKFAVCKMGVTDNDNSSSESEDEFYTDTESLGSFTSEDSSPSASPPHSPALSLPQQLASYSPSSQDDDVDLKHLTELPAFKALEKAYLYRAGIEGKSGIKTHALLAQFLLEARGQIMGKPDRTPDKSKPEMIPDEVKRDLMTQYIKQMDQGKHHEYIVSMVNMIHKADLSKTPQKR